MFSIDLITDRTQADANRVYALARKGWANMTLAEQIEWETALKGAYNYTDLNRVGEAINRIAEELHRFGYYPTVSPKINWQENDDILVADIEHYLADIEVIRSVLANLPSTPRTPAQVKTIAEANAIEQILVDKITIMNNTEQAWFYSADLYVGEV